MLQLNEIGKVGFGSYRISSLSSDHEASLQYALECGCNLMDTASNYENGNSEKLIGKTLNRFNRNLVFIITKAGYISGENLNVLSSLKSKKKVEDLVEISETFKHCIHPDYLNSQIEVSLQRMDCGFIDGFLLHS